jgi:HD-like signal output (HDOD) protein
MRSFCAGKRAIDPGQLQTMLSNFEELPTIPDILFQILKILDDPDSGSKELAEVVRLDAPLTARILRLANSPYYSARGDMVDIHRCIAALGYRTIRQVAICVSVATSLVSAAAKARGQVDYRELWRHSVATGAIAKHLADMAGYPDSEEVFTAGLLHDLGKFVFEIFSPATYGNVIASRKINGQTLVEAERDAFGFDHALLGEAFGFSWRFPEILHLCFGHHHDLLNPGCETGTQAHALALVALADYLANTLVPSACDLGFDPENVCGDNLMTCAGLTPTAVADQYDALKDVVRQSSIFLDLP